MILHASTIALSAFLLFLLQPIVAKQILPWFGGSAAVWTTCMVFFQTVLLAGYAYSDLLIRKLAPRRQALIHAALLVASLAWLPVAVSEAFKPADASNPIGRIVLLLTATIGLPYLMLSTTGPLIQAWFNRAHAGRRVYRLYALSNLASMLALLAYPPLIEPAASVRQQSLGWSLGYAAFVLLGLAAAWRAGRVPVAQEHRRAGAPQAAAAAAPAPQATLTPTSTSAAAAAPEAAPTPGLREHGLWLLLSMLGSVLLLAVTNHITQNVASIPFLWVLPLSLYLASFILCFDGRGWYWRRTYALLSCAAIVLMFGALSWRVDWTVPSIGRGIVPIAEAVPLYAAGLFVLCMFCHGELVARKPAPAHLTRFYLMVSLGGALGGALVGVVAPLALSWYWEFPIALVVLALLLALLTGGWLRPVAIAVLCATLAGGADYLVQVRRDAIEITRNFYGVLRVRTTGSVEAGTARHVLIHGVINHGDQYLSPPRSRQPTTYYGESSGVGLALSALRARDGQPPLRIGVVGLGTGTLAAYGRAGDTLRLYELNPAVLELATRRFTYLRDSAAAIATPLGDARLSLEREAPQAFDLLAVDAFSGDSIPTHLITREAALLYRRHMAADGVIAMHVTNRYIDLAGVTRQMADALGWQAIAVDDAVPEGPGLYKSLWVLITGNPALAGRLIAEGGRPVPPQPGLRAWTDDYNNLFQVLK